MSEADFRFYLRLAVTPRIAFTRGPALEEREAELYMDPEFLKPFDDRGEHVSLGESENRSVELNLLEEPE